MSFQILDENNNAIPINLIDEEVAKFWNVEIDKKYYACPKSNDEKINRRFFQEIGLTQFVISYIAKN